MVDQGEGQRLGGPRVKPVAAGEQDPQRKLAQRRLLKQRTATGVGRKAEEIRSRSNQAASSRGLDRIPDAGKTAAAPSQSAGQISHTEASNAALATWLTRSSGRTQ